MHVHILGIGGTFMGGVAALAQAAGHRVTGSDRSVYPPMSTQLTALGIELIEGYGLEQLELKPDMIVIGNVMSRGMPVIEAVLERARASERSQLPQLRREHHAHAGSNRSPRNCACVSSRRDDAGRAAGGASGSRRDPSR